MPLTADPVRFLRLVHCIKPCVQRFKTAFQMPHDRDGCDDLRGVVRLVHPSAFMIRAISVRLLRSSGPPVAFMVFLSSQRRQQSPAGFGGKRKSAR